MPGSRSIETFEKGIPKKNALFCRFVSDSSARLQSRSWIPPSRGMSRTGLGSVPFWPGNFQCAEKNPRIQYLLPPPYLLCPSSVPTQPLSNESLTVFCILEKSSLASPAPTPLKRGEEKASTYKGGREKGWPPPATRSEAEFLEKLAP